jgi:hypothetical protein
MSETTRHEIGTATGGPPPHGPMSLDITHQRNRLAGVWAAELLGLFGLAAQDYVRNVVHSDHPQDAVHGDDHEKVVVKLSRDLADHVSIGEIRERMAHFLSEARRQILSGKKGQE